jgi:hypothetical protein
MAERKKPRVPLLAVIVGGLVAGAVLFGAFRGVKAQPVSSGTTADPFGALPVPALPPPDASPLPAAPIQQTGAVIPPVMTSPLPALPALPKADAKPEPGAQPVPPTGAPSPLPPVLPADSLPKPVELPAAPKPVEPLPAPKFDPAPAPLPAPTFTREPLPAPPVLPPAKIDPIPDMKPVDPLPKPVEVAPVLPKPEPVLPKPAETPPVLPKLEPVAPLPADTLPRPVEIPQPVKPSDPPSYGVPVKPENRLRPDAGPLTVNPGPAPVGPETLPAPRKVGNETAPLPRPVVEESVTPTPKPDVVVPIAAPYTPGPTPMTLSRHTVLSAVMGAALAAAPAFAADPPAADAEAIKAIQKEIADLKADVKLLKEQRNELNKQLNGIPESQRKTPEEKGALIRMQEAEAAAEKMAAKVKELETSLTQKSVSEKLAVGGSGSGISPGRGIVKLVNEYNVKVSMMVNGTSYPLGVNEVKSIEVPEGKFKYELVEFPNAVAKETTIKEGETVTLRIK